jgi:hypothetical protein
MTEDKNKNSKTFQSLYAYTYFEKAVKSGFRYFGDESTNEFLDTVIATSVGRKVSVCKDEIYWRTQLGYNRKYYVLSPHPEERMKPLFDKAKEGRANPKGISYLYLATNMQTAIQEVRPWLGSHVSVAQFQIVKDLKVVDCSEHTYGLDGTGFDSLYPDILGDQKNKELSSSDIEKCVWSWIDKAFSWPVDPSDDTADYVPTQILAELFKTSGYDGIIYNSLLTKDKDDKNIVLFDIDSAKVLDPKLYQVTKIPPFELREITYNF